MERSAKHIYRNPTVSPAETRRPSLRLPSRDPQAVRLVGGLTMFPGRGLVLLWLCGVCALAQYAPDEVTALPGMAFKPNYRQWSGYLMASPGTFLHYW